MIIFKDWFIDIFYILEMVPTQLVLLLKVVLHLKQKMNHLCHGSNGKKSILSLTQLLLFYGHIHTIFLAK